MDSTQAQTSEGTALVRVLAVVLERLVSSNSEVSKACTVPVTKFHALKAPSISILQYLERIHKYSSCSTECFVLALIYIDRLIQRNNFIVTDLNVHRVVITAVLLAAKFFDDSYYNNAYYAKVGGVPVTEMNGLELEFLFFVQFSLHVNPELFMRYRNELLTHSTWTAVDKPLIGTYDMEQFVTIPPQSDRSQSSSPEPYRDAYTDTSCKLAEQNKREAMEVVSEMESQTPRERCASQISPSPPPSANASPSISIEPDTSKGLLTIDSFKYNSAPARYPYLPHVLVHPVRNRSNSFPVNVKSSASQSSDSSSVDVQQSAVESGVKQIKCHDVTSSCRNKDTSEVHDISQRSSSHVRAASNCFGVYRRNIKPRIDRASHISAYNRCLSVPISPNTSSPRYIDATSSK